MDIFIKAIVIVLITIILYQVLTNQDKNMALLLSLAVCSMILIATAAYLNPVLTFIHELRLIAKIDSEVFTILLKAVGIALLTEISALICSDTGNNALGKSLQLMSAAVILWISIPLFSSLLELIGEILGDV